MKHFTKTILAFLILSSSHIVVLAQQGGYAIKLDGTNDYVDVGTPVATQIANNLTITVWIKPSASTGWRDILTNQWKIYESGLIIAINGATGQLHYAATGTNLNFISRDPASNTLDDKWHHVALTFESGVFKTYLDGTLIDTYNSGLTAIKYSGGYKFLIGRDSGEGGEYFNGLVDEVCIWNTVHTEAQLKAGMYKELTGSETGLVSYYKMAEGTGTTIDDASVNSNSGTLVNGPSWIASACFGGSGKALNFDGTNDYVLMPAGFQNAFDGLSHFSFCGWVYPTNLSGTTWGTFFTNYATFGNWSRVTFHQLVSSYGGGADDVLISVSNVGAYGEAWTTSNVLEVNKWIHLAIVYDGTASGNEGKLKFYVNGKQESLTFPSGTNFPAIFASDANTSYIGRYHNPDYYKGGNFDEFSFWNTTLTQPQVCENMTKTLAGNEPGLFAYYRFDQSDGTTLYDMTANGYHGTLTNMDAATDWVASSAFNTWIGSENSTWSNVANWSNGEPGSAQSVGLYKWALGNEATLSGSPTVNNLLISADASPTISSNFTASGSFIPRKSLTLAGGNTLTSAGSLLIESGKTLTVPATGRLTVTGTLVNNAGNTGLVIESGGSLIESTMGIAATFKRDIPADEWHLISSPVTDVTANNFYGYYLQRHSEPDKKYFDITEETDPLLPLTGYTLFGNAALPAAVFAGPLNAGTVGAANNLTRSGAPASGLVDDYGWNLVGNPYPSSIDWLASGWTKTNVENAVYIHRNSSTWATFVGGAGANLGSRFIAPGQGFFVHMTDNGSPYPRQGTLSMTDAVRVHNTTDFFKSSDEVVPNLVRLQISGNGYYDEAVLRFLGEATSGFDGNYDAHKLYGDVAEAAQIYSIGSIPLSINSMPETDMVPVGVKAGVSGTYTIAATEINDLKYATLEDTKTGIFTELATKTYTFSMDAGEDEMRFKLHFSLLGIKDNKTADATVYSYQKTAYINMKDQVEGDIFIYSLSGQLIATKPAAKGMNDLKLSITGNYIVKVISGKTIQVKKIFIH